MPILKIVTYPDPMLKRISSPIEKAEIDHNLQEFMDNMVKTMNHANGCGLAAVQVGLLKRIFVIDISETKDQPLFFINPEIISLSFNKELMQEGCLSFPGAGAEVNRYNEVEIKFLDYNGTSQQMKASGYLAQAIQHELDHLNGIVYVDHLPLLKRTLIKQKVKKFNSKKNQS